VRGTLARVSGAFIVTETKTPRSRRVVPLPLRRSGCCATFAPSEARAAESGLNVAANAVRVHNRARRALRSSQRAACTEDGSQARRTAFHGRASHTATLCCLGDVVRWSATQLVSEVFGHASVAITGDIYGHVSPEVSREALIRLSDALS